MTTATQNSSRRKVVYILGQIDRIGQLAGEMFYLRNLYHERDFELFVMTAAPEIRPRTNLATYNIVTRGINLIQSLDDRLNWYSHFGHEHQKRNLVVKDDTIFYLFHPEALAPEFFKARRNDEIIYPFELTPDELALGLNLRRQFNIPDEAPIVTLHVRESGYLPEMTWHSHRDSQIDNYLPAMEYLVQQGFYVVRLGDPSMKQLDVRMPQIIDAPFHPAYNHFVEPYFISQSRFYISTGSGPLSLATGFGVPRLHTNLPIIADAWGEPLDLVVYKRYFDKLQNRFLSFDEVMQSSLIDFYKAEDYEAADVELLDNTPEELLAAVQEMCARLDGYYQPMAEIEELNSCVRRIRRQVHESRIENQVGSHVCFLPAYLHELQVSHEYVKTNEHFLPDFSRASLAKPV